MAAGGSFLRQEQAFLYKLDQGLTGLGEGLQFQHTTSIKGIDGFECPVYVRHPEDPLLCFRQACLASSNSKEALVVEEGGAPWRVGADQLIDLYRKVHRTQNDLDILGNFKLCSELYNTLHAAATGGPLVSSSAVRTWGVALSTLGSRGEVSATFAIAGRGFFLRSVRGIGGINALYENEARDLIVYELYHACPGLVAREHMRLVNEQGCPQLPLGDYAARIGEAFVRELVKRMAEIREAVKQLSKEQQKQLCFFTNIAAAEQLARSPPAASGDEQAPKAAPAAAAAAGFEERENKDAEDKQEGADHLHNPFEEEVSVAAKGAAAVAAAGEAPTSPTFGHTSPTFSPSSSRPNRLKRKSGVSLPVEQQGPAAKAGRSGAASEGEGVPLAAAGSIRSHLNSADVEDLLREGEGDFLAAVTRGSSSGSSRQQSPGLQAMMLEGVPVEDAEALLREEGALVAAGAGGEGEGEGGSLAAGAGSPPFSWSLNSSDVAGLPSDMEELEGGSAEQQQAAEGIPQATVPEGVLRAAGATLKQWRQKLHGFLVERGGLQEQQREARVGQELVNWDLQLAADPEATLVNIAPSPLVPIAPSPKAAAGRTASNDIMRNTLAASTSTSLHLALPAAAVAAPPAAEGAGHLHNQSEQEERQMPSTLAASAGRPHKARQAAPAAAAAAEPHEQQEGEEEQKIAGHKSKVRRLEEFKLPSPLAASASHPLQKCKVFISPAANTSYSHQALQAAPAAVAADEEPYEQQEEAGKQEGVAHLHNQSEQEKPAASSPPAAKAASHHQDPSQMFLPGAAAAVGAAGAGAAAAGEDTNSSS